MSKRPFNTNPREDANAAGIDRAVFPPWRVSAEPVRTRAAFHGSGAGLLTVPKYGGVLVGPHELQQLFNDSDEEVLWLIVGAPEEIRVFARFKIQHRLVVVLFGGSDATAKGTRRRGMATKGN